MSDGNAELSDCNNKKGHDMWVSKPIYESLPYFYLVVGGICLAASMYLNHWYWPTICFVVGLACLVAGLVIWLKRRDHRDHDRRASHSHDI
jgi:Flp pilus assembly protein TadB